jgi:hypothetical protein
LSPGSSCFAAKITIAQARQELLHTLKVPEMVSPLWCHNKGFPDWLHYEGITLRSLPLQSKTTWLTVHWSHFLNTGSKFPSQFSGKNCSWLKWK